MLFYRLSLFNPKNYLIHYEVTKSANSAYDLSHEMSKLRFLRFNKQVFFLLKIFSKLLYFFAFVII